MSKKLALLPAALAAILLLVGILYISVASFALTTASYPEEAPYGDMAEALVAYLSGNEPTLPQELFTERERLHMDDVLVLFIGGKQLGYGCLIGGVALGILAFLLGGRRQLGRGLLIGMSVFSAIVLALGVWAAVDFNGWFTTMHELVFTNDLWLLDPAESMLIRMLPLDFFIGAVKTIVLRFAIGMLALLAAALLLQRRPHELSA